MTETTPESPSPALQLMQMITGHWVAVAVHAAAKLGLADRLAGGVEKTAVQLAEEASAHGPSVFRLLRALASLGLFRQSEAGGFSLAPLGEYLRADHPQSMRSMALFQGSPAHWQSWGAFPYSVETGQPAFERVHGKGFFDYCGTDPEFAKAFNGAMTAISASMAEIAVKAYDFSGIRKLCDVGGGHGYLLSAILREYPGLTGVVFDLPEVAAGAASIIGASGVAGRCDIVGGDFFASVPPADAYIAKHIIHDWDDEHARRILLNMRSALAEGGRVLLFEAVIPPGGDPFVAKLMDLEMLHATHGGRERTEDEFRTLLASAGLRLDRIVSTDSHMSILEAFAD